MDYINLILIILGIGMGYFLGTKDSRKENKMFLSEEFERSRREGWKKGYDIGYNEGQVESINKID